MIIYHNIYRKFKYIGRIAVYYTHCSLFYLIFGKRIILKILQHTVAVNSFPIQENKKAKLLTGTVPTKIVQIDELIDCQSGII